MEHVPEAPLMFDQPPYRTVESHPTLNVCDRCRKQEAPVNCEDWATITTNGLVKSRYTHWMFMICDDCKPAFLCAMNSDARTPAAEALNTVADKLERARMAGGAYGQHDRRINGWKSAAEFVRGEALEYGKAGQ